MAYKMFLGSKVEVPVVPLLHNEGYTIHDPFEITNADVLRRAFDTLSRSLSHLVAYLLWALDDSVISIEGRLFSRVPVTYEDFFSKDGSERLDVAFLNNLGSLVAYLQSYVKSNFPVNGEPCLVLPSAASLKKLHQSLTFVENMRHRMLAQENVDSHFPTMNNVLDVLCHATRIVKLLAAPQVLVVNSTETVVLANSEHEGARIAMAALSKGQGDLYQLATTTYSDLCLNRRRRKAFIAQAGDTAHLHAVATVQSLLEMLAPENPNSAAAISFVNHVLGPRLTFVGNQHHTVRARQALELTAQTAAAAPADAPAPLTVPTGIESSHSVNPGWDPLKDDLEVHRASRSASVQQPNTAQPEPNPAQPEPSLAQLEPAPAQPDAAQPGPALAERCPVLPVDEPVSAVPSESYSWAPVAASDSVYSEDGWELDRMTSLEERAISIEELLMADIDSDMHVQPRGSTVGRREYRNLGKLKTQLQLKNLEKKHAT